jgi:hypothetical protein
MDGRSGIATMRVPAAIRIGCSSILVDISHVIRHGMVTYPGLPGPEIGEHLGWEASRERYAPGTEIRIVQISMVANTGTYLDTPAHRYLRGAPGRLCDLWPSRKSTLDLRSRFRSIPVAAPRFWTSCGICSGSLGVWRATTTLRRSSDQVAFGSSQRRFELFFVLQLAHERRFVPRCPGESDQTSDGWCGFVRRLRLG